MRTEMLHYAAGLANARPEGERMNAHGNCSAPTIERQEPVNASGDESGARLGLSPRSPISSPFSSTDLGNLSTVTSRARFSAACAHGTPDRPPVDYLAHPETDRNLRAALGVNSECDLLDRLGADFFYLPGRDISQNEGALPFYKHRDRVRIGGLWTSILGDSYRMVGFQNFLCAMAAEPELVHTLVDRMTEMYLELNDAYFTALKGRLEVWFFGNDFGSQEALLFG